MTTERPKIHHPLRPAPLRLQDERFQACERGTMLCLTPEEAKKIPSNKREIGRFISETDAILDYYESID